MFTSFHISAAVCCPALFAATAAAQAGMGLLVGVLELGEGGVGIDLRGGHAFVAEQTFDGFEVGAVVEHDGGEGVAQDVGRTLGGGGDHGEVGLDDVTHAVGSEAAALWRGEEGQGIGGHIPGALGEVSREGLVHFGTEGHDAVLVALTQDAHLAALHADAIEVHPDEFGDAESAAVEGEQDKVVAVPLEGVRKGDVVEQAVHLGLAQEGRKTAGLAGIGNEAHGVGLNDTDEQEVAKETPQRAHGTAQRLGLYAALRLVGHPQADTVAVNEGPADVGAIVLLAAQKALKTTEVGGDGGQCGGRETAVGGGVVEIVGDMAVHGAAVWGL